MGIVTFLSESYTHLINQHYRRADSVAPDQTEQMYRLIWYYTVCLWHTPNTACGRIWVYSYVFFIPQQRRLADDYNDIEYKGDKRLMLNDM